MKQKTILATVKKRPSSEIASSEIVYGFQNVSQEAGEMVQVLRSLPYISNLRSITGTDRSDAWQ